jgi:hypothetical protein
LRQGHRLLMHPDTRRERFNIGSHQRSLDAR